MKTFTRTVFSFPLYIFLFSLLFLNPAYSQKVKPEAAYLKWEKIALMSVQMYGPTRPVFPLLDAPRFNKKLDLLREEITDEQKARVDKYRKALAENLGKHLQTSVLYGDELHASEKFSEIYSMVQDTNKDLRIVSTGDIPVNPCHFDKKTPVCEEAQRICQELNVDALAFSFAYIWVSDVKRNATPISLVLHLELIDKNGTVTGSYSVFSEDTPTAAENIGDFIVVMDEYKSTYEKLLLKVVKKMQKGK